MLVEIIPANARHPLPVEPAGIEEGRLAQLVAEGRPGAPPSLDVLEPCPEIGVCDLMEAMGAVVSQYS